MIWHDGDFWQAFLNWQLDVEAQERRALILFGRRLKVANRIMAQFGVSIAQAQRGIASLGRAR